MKGKIFCPSIMCADFKNLEKEIDHLEKANIDIYHLDIMDGYYVPNLGLGLEDVKVVRELTKKPMDVHLMVREPNSLIPIFASIGVNIVYFHPETSVISSTTINMIHELNMKAGIAINPETSLSTIEELIPLVEYVLVMTVNPGFSGQRFIESTKNKLCKINKLKKENSFNLMVDGAISEEKVSELSILGVDGFVLGTSALFGKNESYNTILKRLRKIGD